MNHYKESTTKLLNNEKFSDFTIVCGTTGREYKAHRFVISSQSKWFDRCCSRDDLIEGQQRRAVLKEDDPLALERMIEYFYKFDYSDDVSAVNQSHKSPASVVSRGPIADVVAGSITEFPIQLHAHVYAIADKYEVPDLKSIARDKFREELAKNMDSTKIMGAAIAALYLEIELPDSDRKLKDLLAIAWIIPGKRRVTELHTDCLKYVLMAVPDFLFDVQNLLLQGYPGGIDFPDFMCPECDELSIVQPKDTGELWTKASIQCNQCDIHVLPSKFRLNEHLEVERWWAPKHVR